MKRIIPVVALFLVLAVAACNVPTVQAYVNLAVGIALQVAKLAGLPATMANQVSADLATVNKLISDYQAADAKAKSGILAEVDTYLNVAQNDLSAILSAVHVGDPKLQAVIQGSIAIAITAVDSIYQLENGHQPGALAKTAKAAVLVLPGGGVLSKGKTLTPAQLKALYNQTVASYPQARLN